MNSANVSGSNFWQGNPSYIQTGAKAGYATDWQKSIPTAYEMRQNILSKGRAQGAGFASSGDMSAYQSAMNRINVLKGRLGQNYGQNPDTGAWGPGVNADTGIQGEIDARQNQTNNWFTRKPYQNQNQGNGVASRMAWSRLSQDQQTAFYGWLQQQGYLR